MKYVTIILTFIFFPQLLCMEKGASEIMRLALENKNHQVMQFLLETGQCTATPQLDSQPLLDCTANYGAQHGAYEIMQIAIEEQNYETMQFLLKTGQCTLNPPGKRPLLHDAAFYGDPVSLQILLDHGADIHKTDTIENPILFNSCSKQNTRFLISKGVDVNAKNPDGVAALHYLIDSLIHIGSVKVLLKNGGANPNLCDDAGNSPLHYAVSCVNAKGVKLLLKYNVDKNIQNKMGYTPLDFLKKNNDYKDPARYKALQLLDPIENL